MNHVRLGEVPMAYYPYNPMRRAAPAAEAQGEEVVPMFPQPGAFSGSLLQFGRYGGSVWSPTDPMSGAELGSDPPQPPGTTALPASATPSKPTPWPLILYGLTLAGVLGLTVYAVHQIDRGARGWR